MYEYKYEIDEIDKSILRLLCDNGRISFSEIAEHVGLSRAAVKKRIEALERKEIITGYKAIINPAGEPSGVNFIVDIEVKPEHLQEVVDYLSLFKWFRRIYTTDGCSRIHVDGFTPNQAQYKTQMARLHEKPLVNWINQVVFHQLVVCHKDVDGGVVNNGKRKEKSEDGAEVGTVSEG